MRIALVLLLAVGALVAAPVPKPPVRKPADAELVGTWAIVRQDGERAEAGQAFAFDADKVRVSAPQGNGVHTEDHVWTVDKAVTPNRMQWVRKGFPNAKLACLYEVAGDNLKVGFYWLTEAEPDPPKSLEPARGVRVYELRRSK